MDIEDIKVGMKVRLLGKHGGGDNYNNIEDWYKSLSTWSDVQRIKERGYGVVKQILENDRIIVRDELGDLFGWTFLSSDLEPYINEVKFKVGDKVRVKDELLIDTLGSYGGYFVESITSYIGKEFTILAIGKSKKNEDIYFYKLKENDIWCFAEEWLELVEEKKLLLPIGTKIRQVKPRFGMEYLKPCGEIYQVTKADESHIYVLGSAVQISITKQEFEECWEVVEDKWEDVWCSHGVIQYKVHSNGKKVKVKIASGDVGVAICDDSDEFNLEKGIEIARTRAVIKHLEKQVKQLSK